VNKLRRKIGFILVAIGTFSIVTDLLPFRLKVAQAISGAVKFVPPRIPDRGIAGNRFGSASRTSDRDPTLRDPRGDRKYPDLTALVPEYRDPQSKSAPSKVWGLTANEYPTLWFYIPYAQTSISKIDFILKDRDNSGDKVIYQTSIQPSQQAGIINFSLPKISSPLAIDKLYQWQLKLTMKPQPDPKKVTPSKAEEISVTGWIQRASLNQELNDRIARSTPNQQAALYAENGFWYDALSTLALLRRDAPQDPTIQQDWGNLLKSVELGKLANKPIFKLINN
jgi:Domain of Unknown Function (DUF928)